MKKKVLVIFIFISFLAGCGINEISPSTIPSTKTIPIPTKTNSISSTIQATQLIPKPSQTPSHSTTDDYIKNIYRGPEFTIGSIPHLWWSNDSKFLFIQTEKELRQYIPDSGYESAILSGYYSTSTPPFGVNAKIPKNALLISYSPSGKHAIFTIPVNNSENFIATPTIQPTVSGEGRAMPREVELFFVDMSGVQKIGLIDDCSRQFYWSNDEKKVFIVRNNMPVQCHDIWFVYLDLQKVININPNNQGHVSFHTPSPNFSKFIYSSEKSIFVYDLKSEQSTKVDLPISKTIWIDEDNILFTNINTETKSQIIGTINLKSKQQVILVNFLNYANLSGKELNDVKISPNGKLVSFATGTDMYHIDEVWLISLPTYE